MKYMYKRVKRSMKQKELWWKRIWTKGI